MSDLTPFEYLTALLEALDAGVRVNGETAIAQCPAHHDTKPSLKVTGTWSEEHGQDIVLVKCWSVGCTAHQVMDALYLTDKQLFTVEGLDEPEQVATYLKDTGLAPVFPPADWSRAYNPNGGDSGQRLGQHPWPVEAEHPYGDKWLLRRYRNVHTGEKEVRWFTWDNGYWAHGRGGTPPADMPLYRDMQVKASTGPVLVVESESSVDTAWQMGLAATTWASGATTVGSFHTQLQTLLAGRHVILVPDHDDAGEKCTQDLIEILTGVASTIQVVPVTDVLGRDCPKGADARDALEQVGVEALTGQPPKEPAAATPTAAAAALAAEATAGVPAARRYTPPKRHSMQK